ncbi:MAG: class I SAM-dependent methyltransferase [Chitinophagia bacterium]|jgi:SAM-dependent methyltransferase
MDNSLHIGKLSFYWRMTDKPNFPKNPVPDFVDFSFDFMEQYQLLIQTRNEQTWEYLETIYRENYNVGYLQEGHDLAERYGNDFLEFINESINKYNPNTKRIYEIGAGGCYILNKLKKSGFDVAAIDPSPIAIKKGEELGIEVIPEFFPSKEKIPTSDLIIHYDVLEHVSDPVDFLRKHKLSLNKGGMILVAVPDCTSYIESGDISMILHEHLNYFDKESLTNVFEAAGFKVFNVAKANYGGVLYCVAGINDSDNWVPQGGTDKYSAFKASYEKLNRRVADFIKEASIEGNSLGCYIPLRELPYLSIHSITSKVRFFDDNKGIYGQYFDGFNTPIENFDDLINNPVSHLLILSSAFGERIKGKVLKSIPEDKITIFTLHDLL